MKKEITRKFQGEIVTARNEGESVEDYQARRLNFNRKMYGYNEPSSINVAGQREQGARISGYMDGEVVEVRHSKRRPTNDKYPHPKLKVSKRQQRLQAA